MTIDLTRFRVLTFDCYGTLIDWERGILDQVMPWFAAAGVEAEPDLVLTAFGLHQKRHQQMRPALLYPELLRRTWLDVQAGFGLPRDEDQARDFGRGVGDWPPFDDTPAALQSLAGRYELVILSNVDNASLAGSLRQMGAPFHLTVTAEDVGAYKPDRAHFERALAVLASQGFDRGEILHVAQSKFHDVVPAQKLGLATAFIFRRAEKRGTGASIAADATADVTYRSLAALSEAAGEAWEEKTRRP